MSDWLWQLKNVELRDPRGRKKRKQHDVHRARLHIDDLTIRPGVTAIIGASGAGKSSLLNLLVGYEHATQGAIRRFDHASDSSTESGDPSTSLPVYWAPQQGGLWPHLTVREHLLRVMPTADNTSGTDNVAAASRWLAAMDLDEFDDAAAGRRAWPATLSAGERDRLSVLRAVAARPRVVVLDEPLSHIDPSRQHRYWPAILKAIASHTGSMVFATHVAEQVLMYAAHAVFMDKGQVLYAGDVQSLYWRPPTPQLAAALGPGNWLTAEAAGQWLSVTIDQPRCFRPEQIEVVSNPQSMFTLEANHEAGPIAEATLAHAESDQRISLWHRPPGPTIDSSESTESHGLCIGQRVTAKLRGALLSILAWLIVGAMTMSLVACSDADPALNITSSVTWHMPPQRTAVPAPRGADIDDDGNAYVIDTAGRITVFSLTGDVIRQWEMPDHDIGNGEGVCVLRDGRIGIADTHYARIVLFSMQGELLGMFGTKGTDPGQFTYPVSLTQDDEGKLYVAEYGGNDRVQVFTEAGEFLYAFGGFGVGAGEFQRPAGIAWSDGKIFVSDAINNRIQVFKDDGELVGVLGGEHPPTLAFPYDVSIDQTGRLWVPEYGAGRLTCLAADGSVIGRYGSAGMKADQFITPWGLAVDESGRILMLDTGNRRIVELHL